MVSLLHDPWVNFIKDISTRVNCPAVLEGKRTNVLLNEKMVMALQHQFPEHYKCEHNRSKTLEPDGKAIRNTCENMVKQSDSNDRSYKKLTFLGR